MVQKERVLNFPPFAKAEMAIGNEPVGVFQFCFFCYGKLRDSSLTYFPNEKPITGQQSSANRKRENK